MDDNDLIWHYTTSAGLIGVLTEHQLWASSCSFMNDPEEEQFTARAVEKALESLPRNIAGHARSFFRQVVIPNGSDQVFSRRFVVCASRASDSLEMWRAYGPHTVRETFAIGLDPTVPLGPVAVDEPVGTVDLAGWRYVDYGSRNDTVLRAKAMLEAPLTKNLREYTSSPTPADQAEAEYQMGDHMVASADVVNDVYDKLVTTSKHEAYSAEREMRISFLLEDSIRSQNVRYYLRPGPYGPIPYVPLTTAPSWGQGVKTSSRLPIRKVITAPGAPRAALQGVAAALDLGGHIYKGSTAAMDPSVMPSEIVQIAQSVLPFI